MSDWWWYALIIVVVLAVAVVAYMRARSSGATGGSAGDASRDYRGERETDRLGGMSAEDREWEAASLERNRQSQERNRTTPPAE
ncbi:MAG TPA: hypothetical protein VD789_11095 [Thermomicrobiales bacterium]|nr:hypothetical protein [Thermomicrobiales bacterium]